MFLQTQHIQDHISTRQNQHACGLRRASEPANVRQKRRKAQKKGPGVRRFLQKKNANIFMAKGIFGILARILLILKIGTDQESEGYPRIIHWIQLNIMNIKWILRKIFRLGRDFRHLQAPPLLSPAHVAQMPCLQLDCDRFDNPNLGRWFQGAFVPLVQNGPTADVLPTQSDFKKCQIFFGIPHLNHQTFQAIRALRSAISNRFQWTQDLKCWKTPSSLVESPCQKAFRHLWTIPPHIARCWIVCVFKENPKNH